MVSSRLQIRSQNSLGCLECVDTGVYNRLPNVPVLKKSEMIEACGDYINADSNVGLSFINDQMIDIAVKINNIN